MSLNARLSACLFLVAASPALGQACTEVRFAPGAFSGIIEGVAPPEEVLCYTFATGAGQAARVRVLQGNNISFGIAGIAEAQDDVRFTTRARTYQLEVGQLFRSITNEQFRIEIEIR